MPNIYKHKATGKYAIDVKIKGKPKKTFYLNADKKTAKDMAIKVLYEHGVDGSLPHHKPDTLAFKYLADQFLKSDFMQHDIHPQSLKDYKHCLTLFCIRYPGKKCSEIDVDIITKHKRYLLKHKYQGKVLNKHGVSLSRAKKHIMYIQRVFNWALENGIFKSSEFSFPRLKKEAPPKKLPKFLKEKDIKRLLSYPECIPPGTTERARQNILQTIQIAEFVLASGRRIQEVLKLRKKDINFSTGLYQAIGHKTEKNDPNPKVYPLKKRINNIIKPLISNASDDDYVFRDKDGNRLKTSNVGQALRRILERLGIKGIAFRELRHSFGTYMLMKGVDLKTLSELMGHATTATTEVYVHLTKEHLKKAINNPEYDKILDV